jgi:hypothetical protein
MATEIATGASVTVPQTTADHWFRELKMHAADPNMVAESMYRMQEIAKTQIVTSIFADQSVLRFRISPNGKAWAIQILEENRR